MYKVQKAHLPAVFDT